MDLRKNTGPPQPQETRKASKRAHNYAIVAHDHAVESTAMHGHVHGRASDHA